ncbi:hypothetical protein BDV93DRAFT_566279 [Ceratobasidium sp. AG-I]|nr:hypothetical protein BDV93DRAFT_566279 [Ceratobasidium sp. AG-I]
MRMVSTVLRSRPSTLSYESRATFDDTILTLRLSDPADLEIAFEHHQHAVSLVAESHPEMPIWLNGLGELLQIQFELKSNSEDADKAIEHQQRAIFPHT